MKEDWITVQEFTELYGKSKATVHSQVSYHKRWYGTSPEWYRRDGKEGMLNVAYFVYATSLKNDCRRYATSPAEGIYWYLMNYITEMELARKMSVRSFKYQSERSWVEFFNKGLWRIPHQDLSVTARMERGQLEEFIEHGCNILHSLSKRLGIREHEG